MRQPAPARRFALEEHTPPSCPNPIIAVERLTKRVQDSTGTLTILHEIDFTLPRHRSVAIVGASGSGKSTLLSIIAGLDTPTTGTVRLDGVDLFAIDEDERAAVRAAKVGFVFQSFQLLGNLNALENVMLPLELQGRADARVLATEMLRRVGLGERLRHYPRVLSGGEQQRVALARAFVVKPMLLLADEPTGSLDFATGETVMALMLELNREVGTTLVLVTHDSALAAALRRAAADRGRAGQRRDAARRRSLAATDAAPSGARRDASVGELVVGLRLGAKLVAEGRGLLLRQALLDLRLDVGQRRELRGARVLEPDDVIAELRLHRLVGVLALLQLDHRLRELGHVGARRREVEVAAVLGRARILRVLLRQVLELRAGLELGDDRLGLVFLLDQDVLGLVLGAARTGP